MDLSAGGDPHFESQKVRALLAYLACNRDAQLTRDHLADLLWPDSAPDAARRNLRQALYNLRQNLGPRGGEIVDSGNSHTSVRLSLGAEDRLDVDEFLDAWRRGLPGGDELVARELVRAAELYRGDLLAGFLVRGSPDFEDWLVTEQERLRDAAVQTLRALVDHFAARGEYEAAVRECRRLLAIDPLSEESHRELMRLLVLSGRRRKALLQYEELADLLDSELGVEPMPESRELYASILAEDLPAAGGAAKGKASRAPLGPFVPMVGRAEALDDLRRSWQRATEQGARLMLVEGETGVGRTRLLRSFLNQVSAQHRARIVQGRHHEKAPWEGGRAFLSALGNLLDHLGSGAPEDARRGSLAERWHAALDVALAQNDASTAPVVLFVDDLHRASSLAGQLLTSLLQRYHDRPLWLVASTDHGSPPALGAVADHPAVDRLVLTRLCDTDVEEVCRALLGPQRSHEALAHHLFRASEGLPLAMVESINALCDLGVLVPASRRRWNLDAEPTAVEATPDDQMRLIVERVDRLPTSARRLLTLAAVIGPVFDVDLLQRAAREHIGVMEIGIELMLERWLIRQHARRWTDDPRERDLVLWAQGARRGSFEFAHPTIRRAVYEDLNPLRRRSLHRKVGDALAERYDPAGMTRPAGIAHHYLLAAEPEVALPYLRDAAERAVALGDLASAEQLLEHALTALDRAEAAAGERELLCWRELRGEVEAVAQALRGNAEEPREAG